MAGLTSHLTGHLILVPWQNALLGQGGPAICMAIFPMHNMALLNGRAAVSFSGASGQGLKPDAMINGQAYLPIYRTIFKIPKPWPNALQNGRVD